MNLILYLDRECLNKIAVESLVQFFHDKGIGLSSRLTGDLLVITAKPYDGTDDDETLLEITEEMERRIDGLSEALKLYRRIRADDVDAIEQALKDSRANES